MSDFKARLKELATIESTYPHVLSLYLRVKEGGNDRLKSCKIFLKNRLSELNNALQNDSKARQHLEREVAVAERILSQDLSKTTQSLALFIRGGEIIDRFEATFPFEDQVAYRRVPHIAQLAFMDEELEPFLIVALDSRNAKIFDITLGASGQTSAEVRSEVHNQVRSGGWTKMRYQRAIDGQKREHLDDVVAQLKSIVEQWNHKRIMVLGPDRTTAQLLEMLPADLRKRVLDRKSLDAKASEKQIIDLALESFSKAEDEEEGEKLRRARIELHSTSMAVAGLENVWRCLSRGQVFEILLAHDFQETGVECSTCGAVNINNGHVHSTCPSCDAGGESLKDVDLRELFTRTALQYGARIEYIKLPEFRETLGSVAAMLYSPDN